jgi:hypothetical protein
MENDHNLKKASIVAAAILGAAVLIGLASARESTSAASTSPYDRYSASADDYKSSETPNADAFVSGSGVYMDDREKQLYERDPSSRGYTDADMDFIRDHGMTEDEMRAAETVLHEHGIDD